MMRNTANLPLLGAGISGGLSFLTMVVLGTTGSDSTTMSFAAVYGILAAIIAAVAGAIVGGIISWQSLSMIIGGVVGLAVACGLVAMLSVAFGYNDSIFTWFRENGVLLLIVFAPALVVAGSVTGRIAQTAP